MTTNLQKDYINKVTDISISPLNCSNNYFNDKTKNHSPGKRYSLNKFLLTDYLTVGSNQLVFELDAKTYNSNYVIAKKIIDVLEELRYPYEIYSSGGKGIHIEAWFKAPKFKNPQAKESLTKAMSYELSFKDIRTWLWNQVLEQAMISTDLRGVGKIVDFSCMNFNDTQGKTKLLRVCGGRKIYYNAETSKEEIYYKTRILKDEFNNKRLRVNNFEKVRYPPIIEPFIINENEFIDFLNKYNIRNVENKHEPNTYVELKSGYTKLDSVQKILEGMEKGKRSMGAQILAIAMANDGLSEEDQLAIIQTYVDNCSQAGDQFNIEEAKVWMNWVNNQETVFWNCRLAEDIGVHTEELCAYCKKKNKSKYEFLEQSTILKQIEDLLDDEIKGEFETKMLMFLLMLSKDFPSKTGKPGWSILNDPMSQNIILSSISSSGKSYLTKKILPLFGEEGKDYFVISRITKNALNYYTEINMDGKVIFIEEMQGLDDNTAQLRVWMSEGALNLDTVEKEKGEDGIERNEMVKRTTQGQPVFITNQAEGGIGEQLLNRSWVLGLDTSSRQTKDILDFQDDLNQGHIPNHTLKRRKITDAIKLLKPYHFLIPYSNVKILNIPLDEPRSRRDYDKFNTLIKCSAYLHQRQRTIMSKEGYEYIVCSLKDYEVAKKYANNILGATFSGLTNNQIDLLNYIRGKGTEWELDGFTISDLLRGLNKTQPYWRGELKHLVELGYLTVDFGAGNQGHTYHLVMEKAVNLINLPGSKSLVEIEKTGISSLLKRGFAITSEKFSSEPIVDEKIPPVIGEVVKQPNTGDTADVCYNGKTLKEERYKYGVKKNSCDTQLPFIYSKNEIRTYILEYIRKNDKHVIDIEEIIESLGEDKREDIDVTIQSLKGIGEIVEVKPGQVMIL